MPPARPPTDGKIPDIQLLRGVCILMILLEHLKVILVFARQVGDPGLETPFWLGVPIFFVISGYVIVKALERDRYEPVSFLVKRVFRLTPVLLVFLAVYAGVNAIVSQPGWPAEPAAFGSDWRAFRQNIPRILFGYFTLSGKPTSATGPLWSLSVEDQFYGALAAVCLAGVVVLRGRAAGAVRGVLFGASVALYATVVRARLGIQLSDDPVRAFWALSPTVRYLVSLRFEFLPLGVMLALLDGFVRDPLRRALDGRGWVLAGLLLVIPVAAGGLRAEAWQAPQSMLLVAGPCFAGLVLVAAHAPILPPGGRWLAGPLRYFGDRSYTYYVFHTLGLAAAWCVMSASPGRWSWYATGAAPVRFHLGIFLITITLTAVLVEVVYRGVERPLTAVGRRLAGRVRVVPDPAVGPVVGGRRFAGWAVRVPQSARRT